MGLVWKISWRNLFKHKVKSMVIGIIIVVGSLLMSVGNGIISGMEKGMSENIVNSFTGDFVVVSKEEKNDDVLFGMSTTPMELIEDHKKVGELLEKEKLVERHLMVNKGYAIILNEEGDLIDTYLMGVEIDKYVEMFPGSFTVTKGENIEVGDRGALITETSRGLFYDFAGLWYLPEGTEVDKENLPDESKDKISKIRAKRDIVFMGTSDTNSSTDIRVPIKGIIKYKSLNKIWGYFNFIDISSYRECFGYTSMGESLENLSEEQKKLVEFESEDLDSMFGESDFLDESVVTDESYSVEKIMSEVEKSGEPIVIDSGAYNIIFVKRGETIISDGILNYFRNNKAKTIFAQLDRFLIINGFKKKISDKEIIDYMNFRFEKEGLNVRAIDWRKSIGVVGSMASLIKFALNTFVFFLFMIAGIIIMNTITMSAMERKYEIAMMRAIGAKKGFIKKMLFTETFILIFFFGIIGISLGMIVILILSNMGITTENDMLQMVYGGDKLLPIITFGDIILGFVLLVIVTLFSMIYPVKIAGKIKPIDAIARD